jgi:hypothetical protein
VRADSQCPGCGARNTPEARTCEFCGRAFLLRDQPRLGRRLWSLGVLASVVVGGLVAAAALLNAFGLLPRVSGSPPAASTPVVPPRAPATPPAASAPPPDAEPTAEPTEYVRVVNTGGQGVILRREPSTGAARVAARAENAVLQVIGPDESSDGRVWRQVQDAQGNRGWVPADFLAPAAPPGA